MTTSKTCKKCKVVCLDNTGIHIPDDAHYETIAKCNHEWEEHIKPTMSLKDLIIFAKHQQELNINIDNTLNLLWNTIKAQGEIIGAILDYIDMDKKKEAH